MFEWKERWECTRGDYLLLARPDGDGWLWQASCKGLIQQGRAADADAARGKAEQWAENHYADQQGTARQPSALALEIAKAVQIVASGGESVPGMTRRAVDEAAEMLVGDAAFGLQARWEELAGERFQARWKDLELRVFKRRGSWTFSVSLPGEEPLTSGTAVSAEMAKGIAEMEAEERARVAAEKERKLS